MTSEIIIIVVTTLLGHDSDCSEGVYHHQDGPGWLTD